MKFQKIFVLVMMGLIGVDSTWAAKAPVDVFISKNVRRDTGVPMAAMFQIKVLNDVTVHKVATFAIKDDNSEVNCMSAEQSSLSYESPNAYGGGYYQKQRISLDTNGFLIVSHSSSAAPSSELSPVALKTGERFTYTFAFFRDCREAKRYKIIVETNKGAFDFNKNFK